MSILKSAKPFGVLGEVSGSQVGVSGALRASGAAARAFVRGFGRFGGN